MKIISLLFFLFCIVLLTNQEYVKIKKYPKMSWELQTAAGFEKSDANLTIQKSNDDNYFVEYEQHFAKLVYCNVLSNLKISPEYHKLTIDEKFRKPQTEICRKTTSFDGKKKGKCEYGGPGGELFSHKIETYKTDFLIFRCTINIYGDDSKRSHITDRHRIYLTIQPKEKEFFVHKKNSTENFYIRCRRDRIAKPGILKRIKLFDNKPESKSEILLLDDNNHGIQPTTEYLVSDENTSVEVYFFQQTKERLDNIELVCYYEYKKDRGIGIIEEKHTFEITNVGSVTIEDDKWEAFRPKFVEEANFECDLIGRFYSSRSSIWLKQLHIDKGVEVKNPIWKPVTKNGDPDFESSSTREKSKISLKKYSLDGMPINTQSVWKLAFFTTTDEEFQCFMIFSTPLIEGSDEKINNIKSSNDSLPIEMSCGEKKDLPLKWYHENKLLEEETINSEESLYSSISNKLIIKKCNEITMGSYMVFSQKNPSISCDFSYQCVDKYYKLEDLIKMYDDKTKSFNDPKNLYELNYEQFGIDKDDDPYLIYRSPNKANSVIVIWKNYLYVCLILYRIFM